MNEWNGPVCELVTKLRLVGGNGEMMMMADNIISFDYYYLSNLFMVTAISFVEYDEVYIHEEEE